MVDRVKIYVKAGDGGSGCNSFRGKKFSRSRHPDGGLGGKGADVIIKVDRNKQDLAHLQFKRCVRAENGKSGQANKKKGAQGRPCIIKVPPGTIIRDLRNNLLLRDLTEFDAEVIVVKGGVGGKGNTRQREATAGLPGEEMQLSLELKLVADVGIIGYPNVGKSTFLNRISSARAKIADYPFTTISPYLGVLTFAEFDETPDLTIIELPGLIKGSDKGKGIGAQFLQHAERCKVFIHIIDMGAEVDRDPVNDYHNLNQELKSFNPQLFKKPQILVANKMDLPRAEANLKKFSSCIRKRVYPVCAMNGTGIEEILNCLKDYLQKGVSDEKKLTT